ncbi:MAG: acetylornithine transaminase [Dehalococcoidia bacterium]|nr:acetylornithine transaminase [Dehalococcoidia bacterium]
MTNWQEIEKKYHMQLFRRTPITLVRGEGARVWDDQGKEYLDFVAGIASVSLGHAHPILVEAVSHQIRTLAHVSNLYYTIPQLQLAQLLVENSCMDRVFFCNSGAEANEGAVKLARKYGKVHLGGAYEVITTLHSFHGRTLAMLAATGKPEGWVPFSPVPAGFTVVEFDDIEALKKATTGKTCAVLIEPIQGEGGVNIPNPEYLPALRRWCDEKGILLIYDEIQTGVGRTGSLFGYEQVGAEPDIMTLAKGIAGGVPLGAFLAKERACAFDLGDHGSTFGGNPLATAAGYAVVKYIIDNDLSGHAIKMGEYLMARLNVLRSRFETIVDVRGRGLLVGLQFSSDMSAEIVRRCVENGLLLNPVRPNTIRFIPPLIITEAEVDTAVAILAKALEAYA